MRFTRPARWAALVALTAAGTATAVAAPAAAATAPVIPLVMAHKGLHYPYSTAPENSLGAIDLAAGRGVPIEIDILLSKPTTNHPSGVPFVFHDQTLLRMTNHTGYVPNFTADQLADMCLVSVPRGTKCSPYKIPKLSTVLEHAKAADVALDVEIKHDTLTWGQAVAIVKRLEWVDAWSWDVLSGFDAPMILSAWAQPLAQVRKVAERRGDPPLFTEFLATTPDYTPENTTGSAMEALFYKNVT
ncbi:MAG: hypothetical protein QOI15_561, partial [Pseudonocardiales bacterium]|nr:hypothetical protein [Pseudonocardiales bacterium]